MKVQVKNVSINFVEEGDLCGFAITANDAQGREYVLLGDDGLHRVMSYTKADMVVDKIKAAKNLINLEHWDVRAPYGTDAWMLDGMELRQIEDERWGSFEYY